MNATHLICPVCGEILFISGRTYKCKNRHSYDISRKGYVNLMMSQKSSKKRHGDDKLMIDARKRFLDKGFYAPLADALCAEASRYPAKVIADIGCGEGYYDEKLRSAFPSADLYGIDISRDALNYASKCGVYTAAVAASASDIPLKSECADIAVSVFAPVFGGEFSRVIAPDGILIRAVPLREHLYELKQAIYDSAYYNPPDDFIVEGFRIEERREVRFTLTLDDPDDIEALFMMTPYYYKTSRADQEKLRQRTSLSTQAAFGVLIYKKA